MQYSFLSLTTVKKKQFISFNYSTECAQHLRKKKIISFLLGIGDLSGLPYMQSSLSRTIFGVFLSNHTYFQLSIPREINLGAPLDKIFSYMSVITRRRESIFSDWMSTSPHWINICLTTYAHKFSRECQRGHISNASFNFRYRRKKWSPINKAKISLRLIVF